MDIELEYKKKLEREQKIKEKYAIPICGILGIIIVSYIIIVNQGLFIPTGLPVLCVFVYGLIVYISRVKKGCYKLNTSTLKE